MILSSSLCGNLVGTAVALLIIAIGFFKWSFHYWHRKNLPYLEPTVPFGNFSEAIKRKEHIAQTTKRIYEEMKQKGWKHGGIYFLTLPVYVPVNLDYIKNVLAKDFQYFAVRSVYYNEKKNPLEANLVNLGGTRWRHMRTKLTPTFSSGKMKMMFQAVAECQVHLLKKMDEESAKPVDIEEVAGCFTTDIIGSCAFGLDLKSFEHENSPFRIYGKKTAAKLSLKRIVCSGFPKFAAFLNISTIPPQTTDFFMNVVKNTVDYREKNNYRRNDFMQLLIDMKNETQNGASLTIEEVAAQCYIFFLAGFETSSTLMTFAVYELARNPEIQEKVRNEINSVLAKYEGKVTYESIYDMKYLNQVIDETLRMYPPIPHTTRRCVKNYKIPDEEIIIEKETVVIIPILGIHYDKEYYPNPTKFDPERFSEGNKNSRHNYAHLPFGEGPRNCIGMRFGLMQAKVGLSCLVKHYKFSVSHKTQEPLKMQPHSLGLSAVGEIWLDAQKL